MNEEQFRKELKRRIVTEYGTQREAAKAWGIAEQHVSDVVNARRMFSSETLKRIGYKKTVSYSNK